MKVDSLKRSYDLTKEWIHEVQERIGGDEERAYRALTAVLETLRDRMMPQEAVDFGAQLPMVLRGAYYNGYHPAWKPEPFSTLDAFYGAVGESLDHADIVPREAVAAVVPVIKGRVSEGAYKHLVSNMPGPVADRLTSAS